MMNIDSFLTIKNSLPILIVIFITVFCLILLTRIILFFLLNQAYKRYLALKEFGKSKLPLIKKDFIKEDEELMKVKAEIPRAHSQVKAEIKERGPQNGSYEIIPSFEQEQARQELSEVNIIDIVKPVGFWTSMILGQKLTYLIQSAQILNKRGDKGFWASMIEAKEREAGRQHSRGR
jgi:hypothetical protein